MRWYAPDSSDDTETLPVDRSSLTIIAVVADAHADLNQLLRPTFEICRRVAGVPELEPDEAGRRR
jgi:hypothetical protein